MYVTADGADEVTREQFAEAAKAESTIPSSVASSDVLKAGVIVTNTPDGRMKLTDYLTNVEKEIEAEEAARHRDVLAVREQMNRNFAFNKAARAKLNAALLAKMAANAKRAKQHLHSAMAFVQKKFAAAEALQNKRANKIASQHAAELKTMADNKAEAKKMLQTAVSAQQTAMSTLKDKMHARIKSTDEHVAQNGAQMVENAKSAHKALEAQVAHFDTKVAQAASGAAAGRSKLLAQLQSQDKKTREMVSNKIKVSSLTCLCTKLEHNLIL